MTAFRSASWRVSYVLIIYTNPFQYFLWDRLNRMAFLHPWGSPSRAQALRSSTLGQKFPTVQEEGLGTHVQPPKRFQKQGCGLANSKGTRNACIVSAVAVYHEARTRERRAIEIAVR